MRERVYWDGYEGTGANDFDGELNKRSLALADRLALAVNRIPNELTEF